MSPNLVRRLSQCVGALGALNFVAAFAIDVLIGGDAANGKIGNGRYFLSNHGVFTEVSRAIFEYSLWHWRSVFVTLPLAIVGGAIVADQDHRTAKKQG